jgi:hypothetical protein
MFVSTMPASVNASAKEDVMLHQVSRRWRAAAVTLTVALGLVHAQGFAQEHAHHGAGGAVRQLQLNDGARWQTDAPLRAGMGRIRAAFDTHHPAIHAGRESDAQYAALATTIEREVNTIIANCKLPPAADANLHLVIADLLGGAAAMRGQGGASRHDGAALVHGALLAYGKYFDDPGWGKDGAGGA